MRYQYLRLNSRGQMWTQWIMNTYIVAILLAAIPISYLAGTETAATIFMGVGLFALVLFVLLNGKASYEADDSGVTFKSLLSTERIEYAEIINTGLENFVGEQRQKYGKRRYYAERLTIVTRRGNFVYCAKSLDLRDAPKDQYQLQQMLANEGLARLKAYIDTRIYRV